MKRFWMLVAVSSVSAIALRAGSPGFARRRLFRTLLFSEDIVSGWGARPTRDATELLVRNVGTERLLVTQKRAAELLSVN